MSADSDPSFLSQIVTWTAGAIAAVGSWLWMHTMGRIASVERGKLDREDFDKHVQRVDRERTEMRETQITLFKKVDDLRDHVDAKFEKLMDAVREQR